MLLQSDCGVGIRGREGEQVSPAGRCDVGCARGRLRGAGVSIAGATAVRARSEGPEPELDDHGVFAVQIGGAVRVPDHVLAVHAVLRSLAVLLAASHLLLDRPLRFLSFSISLILDPHRRTHHQTRSLRRGPSLQPAALRLLQRRRARPFAGLLHRELPRHSRARAGAGRDHRERVHFLFRRGGERLPDASDVLRGVSAAGHHDDPRSAQLFGPSLLRDSSLPRRARLLHRSPRFLALRGARRLFRAPV